jgi:hypothetical protein
MIKDKKEFDIDKMEKTQKQYVDQRIKQLEKQLAKLKKAA